MSKKAALYAAKHVLLHINVRPNAKMNAIREINHSNEIRIDIAADAQNGEANKELIDYMKCLLKIPSSQLEIIHGHRQREKLLRILITDEQQSDTLLERLRNEIRLK
jgi:uncharacterized protein